MLRKARENPNGVIRENSLVIGSDLLTLEWDKESKCQWLNGSVIEEYMRLIVQRSRGRVHAMSTNFVDTLEKKGYSGVQRWTRKIDIFNMDIILVPVHLINHWCMAIIDMKKKTIKYYNSFDMPNDALLDALAKYIQWEHLDKKKVAFDMSGWEVENVWDRPRQENGIDWGVFSCMYAEFIARNRPLYGSFTQGNMPYFRQKMIAEISRGQLIN